MMKPVSDRVRILLIDDHVLFREGLARLLQSEHGFTVVAHCGSRPEAIPSSSRGQWMSSCWTWISALKREPIFWTIFGRCVSKGRYYW